MQGKIGLEEHFAIPETLMDSKGFLPDRVWDELQARLLDMGAKRLGYMDAHGVERMIVSLNAPAIQAIHEPKRAIETARRANDALAEAVARHPKRFSGLAALPLQDPQAAIAELERCVKDLKFVGALANGFSQVNEPGGRNCAALYYDLPEYLPFWAAMERLDLPFYLHPRNPLPGDLRMYEGHNWLLGPTWAFAVETATHALRLMGSGLFDKHPGLKIILGHLGEGLPFNIWRVDNRNGWSNSEHHCPAKRKMGDYFRENFWLTTAGNFRTQTMIDSITEIGIGHVLFSTDYPFEDVSDAAVWFDALPFAPADLTRMGRTNALELFKLPG